MAWASWDSTVLSGSSQTSAASLQGEITIRDLFHFCPRLMLHADLRLCLSQMPSLLSARARTGLQVKDVLESGF